MYVLIIRMCATLLMIVLLMSTACSGPLATFPSTPYPSPAATVPPTVAMPPSPVTLLPTFTPAPTPVPRVLLVDAARTRPNQSAGLWHQLQLRHQVLGDRQRAEFVRGQSWLERLRHGRLQPTVARVGPQRLRLCHWGRAVREYGYNKIEGDRS
jgi:hypothetical protein